MCGRITCFLAPEDLSCSCKYRDVSAQESEVSWVPEKFQSVQYAPSYNMGPRDTVACIVAGSHFNDKSDRVLCPMMWGMIPPWHKGEYKKHSASTHNGRLEGLDTSKLYGKPFSQGKRCAVVINGFYEWKTDKQTGKKQPYYMYKKSADDLPIEKQVLNLAGLFDKWTTSNDVLSWLHHRSPVVLQTEESVRDWLDYRKVSSSEALGKLQRSILSETALQWHPVASTVNNVRNKDKSCNERVEIGKEKKKPAGGLMSAWLTTGSMKSKKRQSTDLDDRKDSDVAQQRAKVPRKD